MIPARPAIGFVGAGAVGRALATAFARQGLSVRLARARPDAEPGASDVDFTWAASPDELAAAVDVTFLTVHDDVIGPLCGRIRWRPGQGVVHCSGATELSALEPARRAGAVVGGFHPMQMFANPAVALEGLPGCVAGIEANAPLTETLTTLARLLGMRPITLAPGVRARYHASATYVGPFVLALLREASAIWASFGGTEDEAMAALAPLLKGTLAAAVDRGLAGGMGGCVARGDIGTVRRHMAALDAMDPDTGALYRALTRRTVPLALERGTLAPERAREILSALEE